ncbi:hypothetical protein [Citrobacter sp. TSA-1]|uniref:hypothetical protein n=1 Tax=Citrobacter sp. TSA-1 TaxID=184912 RepID=UPI000BADE5C1|nr:hypothetical protein [Citrobacter sp. TSA-1]PAX80016.1 hypothetical protein CIK43_09080 [Citrobacter sp. TSA-1]QKE19767.1 hypothetical protein HF677_008800 [Citrobacter sp. TSA-1]
MSNSKYIDLDARIKKLKEVVKDLDTNTLATYSFWEMYKFGTLGQKIELQSPARQILYLFGIACASAEPTEPTDNVEGKIKQTVEILNDIFTKYMLAYFPTKDDLKSGLEDEWHKVREVAMPMFSNYFFEGLKVSTENFKGIIKNYFNGFENEIKTYFGLDHHEMVEILNLIGELIQSKYDRFREIMDTLKDEHEKFKENNFDKYEDFITYMDDMRERTKHLAQEFHDFLNGSVSFRFDSIRCKLGDDVVDSFIKAFVTERGNSSEIKYITDENPFSYKPIVTVNNLDYMLPSANAAYEAIILNLEKFFKESKHNDKFRKARDNRLEHETFCTFRDFFPESTTILESVFETNKSHNEHDLIIFHNKTILIVEAKASPRRAPLREPARAYIRIRDDFKRKSGIQSASEQANNLRNLIINNEKTSLYDKKGNLLYTINRCDYDNIYCICVTKDDFGMLATNLTLMLEKKEDEPYPWVICIQDLKFYFDCLKEIDLDHDYFLNYIRERIKIHGKATACDELEYAGAYLNYGGFDFINKEVNSNVFLDISESRVFDEIHIEKINGRKYVHQIKKPTYSILNRDKLISSLNFKHSNKDAKKAKSKRKEQKKSRKRNR